jgi:predicted phosphodiesterase
VDRLQDARLQNTTQVVITGHSHKPVIQNVDRILYLNPGAAGRQGFHLERTAMLIRLGVSIDTTLIRLGPRSEGAARRNTGNATAGERRTA